MTKRVIVFLDDIYNSRFLLIAFHQCPLQTPSLPPCAPGEKNHSPSPPQSRGRIGALSLPPLNTEQRTAG
ncbi:hypothetical protein E2C01_063466 [Portunus trituberculatus]|uniref:Uncharacterized protein n=1 Tax=Portunus trituberculatus TaxID=210409 RepID=A0A5B7HHP4_PORTR|nr:hypothetical protein [Portunus trituberculatus]